MNRWIEKGLLSTATVAAATFSLALTGCSSTPGGHPGVDMGPMGCTSPTDTAACSGKSQYVVNSILLPPTAVAAVCTPSAPTCRYSLKLDGDAQHHYDNALGSILAALSSQGFDLQGTVNKSVGGGKIILLWQFYGSGKFGPNEAPDALQAFLGKPAGSTMCLDGGAPDGGCGPLFGGMGEFAIDSAGPSTPAFFRGATSGGIFTGGPTTFALSFPFSTTSAPIPLTLYGAKSQGQVSASGIMNGVVGGAIKISDVNFVLLPQIATVLNGTIAKDPTGSTAMNILSIFDGTCNDSSLAACPYNGTTDPTTGMPFPASACECASDNSISANEIFQNSLIHATLEKPDLDLFDGCQGKDPTTVKVTDPCVDMGNYDPLKDGVKDSLSLGLGFTAVPAKIDGAP